MIRIIRWVDLALFSNTNESCISVEIPREAITCYFCNKFRGLKHRGLKHCQHCCCRTSSSEMLTNPIHAFLLAKQFNFFCFGKPFSGLREGWGVGGVVSNFEDWYCWVGGWLCFFSFAGCVGRLFFFSLFPVMYLLALLKCFDSCESLGEPRLGSRIEIPIIIPAFRGANLASYKLLYLTHSS